MESIRILFVCTGNICRSPTAEAVFRHQVLEAGLDGRFQIDSAGTHGYHIGDPPDSRAIATALQRGVDMRGLKARKVRPDDFRAFHHVYAMDRGHHGLLMAFAPLPPFGELSLFLENTDVPDPYYGTSKDFEDVYDLIEKGSAALLWGLKARYGF
jgi:protein-tyrosine phosphatase